MTNNTTKIKVRVYFADTDAGGVAHHASYIRWLEQARTEWLEERNLSIDLWEELAVIFVVSHIDIKYIKPILLNAQITVTARLIEQHNAWVAVEQEIFVGEELMAQAKVKLVCVNTKSKKPSRIPEKLKIN